MNLWLDTLLLLCWTAKSTLNTVTLTSAVDVPVTLRTLQFW